MKQAIIDIGSNSIRLTLYELNGDKFKILFREKIVAGLAGYVVNGALSNEGIECACDALLSFMETLKSLKIKNLSIFATASLRNISNSNQALGIIRSATGLSVEIISGETEALLGYSGAMRELKLTQGAFIDIGGASTEIVSFDKSEAVSSASFGIGSLSLYKSCVKNIIPGKGSIKRLKKVISDSIEISEAKQSLLVGTGGTCRAALKLAKRRNGLPENCNKVSAEQINELCEFLCSGDKTAIDFILRHEADRIHTIIPGMLILQHILKSFDAKHLIVSNYGVREGYLCQHLIQEKKSTNTHKTEN